MDMPLEPSAPSRVVLASLPGALSNLAFCELGKEFIEVATSR